MNDRPSPTITIFGYGSLLSEWSCLKTCPSACNHRVACIYGYARVFNLVSVSQLKNGNANVEKNEIAAVSVKKSHDSSCQCLGVVFDINASDFEQLKVREHRYNITQMKAHDGADDSTFVDCHVFTASDDATYKLKCSKEGATVFHDVVGQFYGGSLWGRTDIYPVLKYLKFCCNAASKLTFRGDKEIVKKNFMESLLSDGVETVKEYMERIAEEEELVTDERSSERSSVTLEKGGESKR
jgi:cation transport regulator ChaC